jgi:hypothetical protein
MIGLRAESAQGRIFDESRRVGGEIFFFRVEKEYRGVPEGQLLDACVRRPAAGGDVSRRVI